MVDHDVMQLNIVMGQRQPGQRLIVRTERSLYVSVLAVCYVFLMEHFSTV